MIALCTREGDICYIHANRRSCVGKIMRSLADVESFGAIDADADKLLDTCFEDHEAYLDARSHAKFLVLGRKGSGKTAIYRKLLRDARHDSFSFGHDFTDYPWHLHDKQGHAGVPEEHRFLQSWRYLILLTLSKSSPEPGPFATVERLRARRFGKSGTVRG
jgi:hypothetical protein